MKKQRPTFARLPGLAAAALLAVLPPTGVDARAMGSPVFADFQRFCLDKLGDLDATAAAAKAAGFEQFDTRSTDLEGSVAFMTEKGGVRRLVSIERKEIPAEPPAPEAEQFTCGNGQDAPDAALAKEAARWAGVPADPAHSESGNVAYVFTIGPDGRRQNLSDATDEEFADAERGAGVWLLLVNDNDAPAVVLVYVRAVKSP